MAENHLREDASDVLFDALNDVMLLRPLLEVSRQEIEAYAAEHNLSYVADETNQDTRFLRNRLRHEVLPLLQTLNPNFTDALTRMAAIVQGDYDVVLSEARQAVARNVDWLENDTAYIDRHQFKTELVGVQRHIMREVLTEISPEIKEIPYHHIETACEMARSGTTGQQLSLPAEMVLTVGYDEVTIHAGEQMPFPRHIPHLRPDEVVYLDADGDSIYSADHMEFYTYWVIEGRSPDLYRDDPLEATLSVPAGAEMTLRTRRSGDRFQPFGMGGKSQKISDVFINLKIPKYLRDRVPLLLVNDQIAWFVAPTAAGLQGRIADPFAVHPDTESVLRVRWQRRNINE
jgi:tRNA(Ile)-lysidine synthase